jgi:hypothetical protein
LSCSSFLSMQRRSGLETPLRGDILQLLHVIICPDAVAPCHVQNPGWKLYSGNLTGGLIANGQALLLPIGTPTEDSAVMSASALYGLVTNAVLSAPSNWALTSPGPSPVAKMTGKEG